jgi:hypothetical protein
VVLGGGKQDLDCTDPEALDKLTNATKEYISRSRSKLAEVAAIICGDCARPSLSADAAAAPTPPACAAQTLATRQGVLLFEAAPLVRPATHLFVWRFPTTPVGRGHLYAWDLPREGRCLGGRGVSCPHAQPGPPPTGCHQLPHRSSTLSLSLSLSPISVG